MGWRTMDTKTRQKKANLVGITLLVTGCTEVLVGPVQDLGVNEGAQRILLENIVTLDKLQGK